MGHRACTVSLRSSVAIEKNCSGVPTFPLDRFALHSR